MVYSRTLAKHLAKSENTQSQKFFCFKLLRKVIKIAIFAPVFAIFFHFRELFIVFLSLAILALLTNSSIVAAETENSKISGTVNMLTDTFQLPKNLEIQLIVLEGTKQPSSISTIADQDGNFEFIVNANEKYHYIPLLIYEGVRYLSEPQSINFSKTSENKKI